MEFNADIKVNPGADNGSGERAASNPADSEENETMADRQNIQIDLVKLAGGGRLLRLSEPQSGLSLEKRLDPQKPVVGQKEKLLGVLEAARARAKLVAA